MVLHVLKLVSLWCRAVSIYTAIQFKKTYKSRKAEDFGVTNFAESRESEGTQKVTLFILLLSMQEFSV